MSLLAIGRAIYATCLGLLVYPLVFGYHRQHDSYSLEDALIQYISLAASIVYVLVPQEFSSTSQRAAGLSLTCIVVLCLAPYATFFAALSSARISFLNRLHSAAGFIAGILLFMHILLALYKPTDIPILTDKGALIGVISICLLMILSSKVMRERFYAAFFRIHQVLAVASIVGIAKHLQFHSYHPGAYLYIPAAAFGAFLVALLGLALYRLAVNFQQGKWPRAILQTPKEGDALVQLSSNMTSEVKSGQFVTLWFFRSVAKLSPILQSGRFVVVSASGAQHNTLQIFVDPRSQLMTRLLAHGPGEQIVSAFITGPYGNIVQAEHFEVVLMVANDLGVVSHLGQINLLLASRSNKSSRTRRVHLVWQVGSTMHQVSERSVKKLLNQALEEDISQDFIHMSVYDETQEKREDDKRGNRLTIFTGSADIDSIMRQEVDMLTTIRLSEAQKRIVILVSNSKEHRKLRKITSKSKINDIVHIVNIR
ncbi:cell surface metalloreductase [Colletotrichum chrysophilum]|uniref:Cell surface metalloreductase n=1 Tax=Colletotrichum chrysophilum TaxID=1836956 RepID=A0AAD9EAP6_9PEZI|nr:cell surface metalloreductase [Colletotrichum chrysophilum]